MCYKPNSEHEQRHNFINIPRSPRVCSHYTTIFTVKKKCRFLNVFEFNKLFETKNLALLECVRSTFVFGVVLRLKR